MTSGPANACPCPHCKKPNDFSDTDVVEEAIYACDSCGKQFEIVQVKAVTVIQLKPVEK